MAPLFNYGRMKKCINCRQEKNTQEFKPMRISIDGYCLLCNSCLEWLRPQDGFWPMYAELQNDNLTNIGVKVYALKQSHSGLPILYKKYKYTKPVIPEPLKAARLHMKKHPVPKRRYEKIRASRIIQYDRQGYEVGAYNTIFEASTATGISNYDIARVLDTDKLTEGYKFILSTKGG